MDGSSMRRWLGTLLVVTGATMSAADKPLEVQVRSVSNSLVVVRAFVEPNDGNRSIEFVVDSPDFYGSSTRQLNGAHAPREQEVRFPDVPTGDYQVTVTLIGVSGYMKRITYPFTVS